MNRKLLKKCEQPGILRIPLQIYFTFKKIRLKEQINRHKSRIDSADIEIGRCEIALTMLEAHK